GGYGNFVLITHGNGFATLYGHLSSIAVSTGQGVRRGQVIGAEGSTGYSTGPHLHLEIRHNGAYQNPLSYLARLCCEEGCSDWAAWCCCWPSSRPASTATRRSASTSRPCGCAPRPRARA